MCIFLLMILSYSRIICWISNPFSTDLPLHLYLKSVVSACMIYFWLSLVVLVIYSTVVIPTTTLLVTNLCKFWNQVVLVLQIYTFSKLLWLFQVLSVSMLFLDLSFKFRRFLAFWLELHWIYMSILGIVRFLICKNYNLALI